MIVSPGSRLSASSMTTCSVAAPAGTITHATRGAFRMVAKSFSVVVPFAPSLTSCCTSLESVAKPTTSCLPRRSRRAMLPPIRPSPTIPICMVSAPLVASSGDRLLDGRAQLLESGRHVRSQVHPQRAAAPLLEHLEVAAGLRRLHHSERVCLSRHRQIRRVVAGDLQEDPRARAALVGLAGRVKEARAEADAGGDLVSVTDRRPHLLQLGLVRVRHLDVRQQGDVVIGLDPGQMPRELRGNVAVVDAEQRLGGSVPVVSYSVVSLRVAVLLASTSGWLNVLIPSTEPATAVANSQRKNSAPRS